MYLWFGYVLYDGIEHGCDVLGGVVEVGAHPSLLGRAVYGGEIELFLCGIKVAHQVKHHLLYFIRAAVGFVHLIDHYYRLESHLDCFLKSKAGLWQSVYE